MSNDLISRSALLEEFLKEKEFIQKGIGKDAEYAYMSADFVMHKINSQPTAYDVDKVIEKFEEVKNPTYHEDGSLIGQRTFIRIDKAIEVVQEVE